MKIDSSRSDTVAGVEGVDDVVRGPGKQVLLLDLSNQRMHVKFRRHQVKVDQLIDRVKGTLWLDRKPVQIRTGVENGLQRINVQRLPDGGEAQTSAGPAAGRKLIHVASCNMYQIVKSTLLARSQCRGE